MLPFRQFRLSDTRWQVLEQVMTDKIYSAPASGPAEHRQLFHEDEDELSDIRSIYSSIADLRSQVQALSCYVGKEFTDLERDLQRVAACADCLVISARTDAPPNDSDAANSRGEHLLLPIRTQNNFNKSNIIKTRNATH
jgi:hypothetical protein